MRDKIPLKSIMGSKIIQAIRQSLILCIPILMIGSIALVIRTLPIEDYQVFLQSASGIKLLYLLELLSANTSGILSLVLLVSISYIYGELRGEEHTTCIIMAIVVLCAYMAYATGSSGFTREVFGISWLFTSVIVASGASILFVYIKGLKFSKKKRDIPWADMRVSIAMESIIPGTVVIVLFGGLNYLTLYWLNGPNLQNIFLYLATHILDNFEGGLLAALVYVFFLQLFWFFGIHGGNILDPVAKVHFEIGVTTNLDLLACGCKPNIIFTKTFFDVFVFMGGCGSLICLLIAIMLKGKSTKRVGKLSIVAILFNINEILLLGIPIVLNPIMLIPFILVPIVLTITSYVALYLGLVPVTIQSISWVTPIFISGFLATQSVLGVILQLVNLIIGVCIYIPFIKHLEKSKEQAMERGIDVVTEHVKALEQDGQNRVEISPGVRGIRQHMIVDLRRAMEEDKLALYYQPQHNVSGELVGVEALLRWQHYTGKFIYPPLIIDLAREGDLIDELGRWILEQACKDLEIVKCLTGRSIKMSINITVEQLNNPALIQEIENALKRYKVQPNELGIELTEQVALIPTKTIEDLLARLREKGVQVLMDDFGMGHSSISYLQSVQFDTIKLDGSLVKGMLGNERSKDIIKSIMELSKRMEFDVIAEYVETVEQKEALAQLGCEIYQGYLYSPALKLRDLMKYVSTLEY